MIFRLNTGESVTFSRSKCFSCGRQLKWPELIPVLSFLFLRGRCANCGSKISRQYPALELASGALFLLLWSELSSNQFGQSLALTTVAILFFWLLLIISVYDIRHKIIPSQLVYPAVVAAALFLVLGIKNFMPHIFSGLGFFAFFAILWAASKGKWMGFGDAKMAFALGLFLGWPETLAAFFFSFWLGAFFGLILAFYNYKLKAKSYKLLSGTQIPFAPFLFAGGLFAFLWGGRIISWYLSLI